ncbi:MAG: Nramp family divalent metal transporter [Methanomassiliicoccales archaeon]|jgi:NRAMP (natural resistance-associated macrophage protein)-like metal ion transporter
MWDKNRKERKGAGMTKGTGSSSMSFGARSYYRYRKFIKTLQIYLLLAGPGIIVMVADNDAGGITTYSVTGAQYGYSLIWFLILLGPIAYFVQEMTVRLGAVTKRGHAEAIFDAFGSFWGWFSLSDLALTDWLTLITEFIGMTAALSIFGIPPILTVVIVSFFMILLVINGKYWTFEKIVLLLCVLNLIYIPAALLVHPNVSQVVQGVIPNLPGGPLGLLFFLLMANIGTTIAPWMLFFQQSSVVDKGMKEKDIPFGRMDTAMGAILTVVVAVFLIIVTGTLLYGQHIESAAQAAVSLQGINYWVGTFLAIGLFDAGLLGAIAISLASSWAVGEVFGWAHSLNHKVREAPWFYVFYFFMLVSAGGMVLISTQATLVVVTLFVQVIAVTLLPAALVFLLLLLNSEELMGKYKNTRRQNIIGFSIVGMIILLSTMYAISVLFPSLLGGV